MQDRFQPNFGQRRQSEAAKIVNLEAFRAAIDPVDDGVGLEPVGPATDLEKRSDSFLKPVLTRIPRKLRYPVLAATAGVTLLGSACGVNKTETPQVTYEGQVLGVNVTPVPSLSGESGLPIPAELTPQVEQSKKAPDFTLKDANGNPVSLHDFAGRPLIIEYAQSNCPPCNFESAKLGEVKKKYTGQGLTVLNISTSIDANFSRDVPVLLDPDSKFAEAYAIVAGVPVAIFIDRSGNEVYRYPGYSRESSDLNLLADAFMAGRDLNNVLPTPTPEPTVTPLPTQAPESERSNSAEVINLGNFDFGIIGWQEFTNVKPNERYSSDGKSVFAYTKHVVVRAIARNKTDGWQEFTGIKPNYAESGGLQLVGLDGEPLWINPGLVPILTDTVVPLDYEGVFGDPFEPYKDGTYRSIDRLYQPEHHPLRLVPPGFGLPVFMDFEVPVQDNEYSLKFEVQYQGKKETKIIKKGQKVDNFGLIAPNARISDSNESLDAKSEGVGDYSFKILGSTKGNMVPGTASHDLLLFDIKNKMQREAYPLGYMLGMVYLKDGRVVSLEEPNPKFAPGQEQIMGVYLGTEDPHADFPVSPNKFLDDTFNFDLKGSVLVLGVLGQWKAWEIPEGTNVPVGKGGE